MEKPEQDILKLKNWRPLTLLNVQNKIYTKALAKRLQKTQASLIHNEQTGFVKGRQMSTNIVKILEIMNHCDIKEINAVIISFDFLKAFDTVEWNTIFHTMEQFNFGQEFIKMMKIIFEKPLICVQNNGHMSEYITPMRGTRQGCCFSPLIFTLVVEILGLAIRQDKQLRGIKIGSTEIKSGQFADDLWATLMAKESNINRMLKLLIRYENYAGLAINAKKTNVLKIGPWKNTEAKCYTLKKLYWSPGPITILGFYIYLDAKVMQMKNFDNMFDKIDGILERWRSRDLTIIGKITVVNHLVNSLMIHKLTALPTPDENFFQKYKAKITKFIWNNKIPRLGYERLTQDYDKIGLKLVDLRTKEIALKSAWIAKYYEQVTDTEWFYDKLLIKSSKVWFCNLSPKEFSSKEGRSSDKLNVAHSFLLAWCKFNFEETIENPEQMLNMVIWANSLIKRQNSEILDAQFRNSRIEKVMDIYNFVQKRFMNYQEVQREYGIEWGYLNYLGILAVIPKVWKINIRVLDITEPIDIDSKIDKILQQKSGSKWVYWKIINRQYIGNKILKELWEQDLELKMNDVEWENIFINFRKSVSSTKLQSFQFR